MKKIYNNWKIALHDRRIRVMTIVAMTLVFLSLSMLRKFLLFNETRVGMTFADPFLSLFAPIDVNWTTFILIYLFLLWGIFLILEKPREAIVWALAYAFLVIIRIFTLYSLPLEPPTNMITLHDPVVSAFTLAGTPVKDLFFSGHTATSFLVWLGVRHKKVAPLFLAATVAIALCVLVQHVHYSIDVVAAPFFSYFAFRLGKGFARIFLGRDADAINQDVR